MPSMSPQSLRSALIRSWLAVVALLLVASFPYGVRAQVPPPDPGAVRVTSSLRPEIRLDAGRSDAYLVTVANSGPQDVDVRIAQEDFVVTESGDVRTLPVSSTATSNASWLEAASHVRVPAGGTASVPVALEVPNGASPGTYWSLLVLEPEDASGAEEVEDGGGVTTSITVKVRIGVSLITHVGEPSGGTLRFRDPALRDHGENEASLSVTIDNPDAFLAEADVWLELYDGAGAVVRRVDAEAARIYPGAALRRTFELGSLDAAGYQAVVIADAGDDRVYGVRYDLALTDD